MTDPKESFLHGLEAIASLRKFLLKVQAANSEAMLQLYTVANDFLMAAKIYLLGWASSRLKVAVSAEQLLISFERRCLPQLEMRIQMVSNAVFQQDGR
jgi:hypothetical protein